MKLHVLGFCIIIILLAGCVNVGQSVNTPVSAHEKLERGKLPWEAAFFKADPREVIKASENISLEKEADARILYRELIYSFDQEGRLNWNFRIVYKILNANGITYWSSISQSWDPWYQERPVLKARVCNPNGKAYLLTPEHIVESGEKEDNVNMFSERRYLRAPLPNVTIGSVVEIEYSITEKKPFFNDGVVQYMDICNRNPIYRQKIVLETADGLPFRYKVYGQEGLTPEIKTYSGYTRYTFDFENLPPEKDYEPARKVEQPFWPCIAFATGESWNKIAVSYNEYINQALQDQDFSANISKLKAGDVKQSAVNIIEWLNKRIRYTGLELGINSIVPAQPSKTLARGFGDCKDKATVVVGMLRQMGYKANVALVNAGFGLDANRDLPGLGQFNHAIVYVNEQGGLWFDPTAEYSRDNYFPISIQNRNALIIDPATAGLVTIPKAAAKANRVVRKKEIFLQNDGKGNAAETTVHFGSEEDYIRAQMAHIPKENLDKNIRDYIDAKFGGGALEDFSITDSTDLSKPFTIKLKVKEIPRAVTRLYLAQVLVNQAEIFSYIPSVFLQDLEEDRQAGFVFYQPTEFEIQYSIHPPLGFVPRSLPADDTLKLGTMTLERKFSVGEHNSVHISLCLNTGKDEISAAEFMDIHSAVADFMKQQQMIVDFDHKGLLLLKQGDYKGSLSYFYFLTRQDEKNPLHRIRYAFALLQAGLGQKARTVVEEAVKLSPKSTEVLSARAWILEHDILGRRYEEGYDRDGAIDSYKKALTLDKDNIDYNIKLASLLEYDKEGFRFSRGADLDQAITHFRHVYDDLGFKKIQSNLVLALLHAEHYAELAKLALEIEDKDARSLITIVAVSGDKGIDEGLNELKKINSVEKRKSIELEASTLLFRVRHYKESSVLLRDAARDSSDAMQLDSRADVYQKLKKHEDIVYIEGNPESLVKNYLHDFFISGGKDFSILKKYVTDDFYNNNMDEDNPYNFPREYNLFKHGAISSELPKDVALDLFFGLTKLTSDGNKEDGFRVVLQSADSSLSRGGVFYLKNTAHGLRIVANQFFVSAIGKQVYDYYLSRQTKKAEKWLDWYYKDFAIFQTDAKEVFQGRPFQKFWNPNNRDIKLAAACIMAEGTFAGQAEPVLVNAYKKAKTKIEKDNLDYALQLVYVNMNQYSKQIKVLARLYDTYPDSEKIFYYYTNSLISNGDYAKAEQLLSKHLADDPNEKRAHSLLLRDYAYKLDFTAMEKQMKKCIDLNAIGENDYNLVAWVELFNSTLNPRALEYARTAMKLSDEKEDYIIHTMATLYAEVGRCQEAWQLINKVMLASGNSAPSNSDWYVFGRIAEQYGEKDEAIKAYDRVKPPKNRPHDSISTFILAQKRLKLLKDGR